MRTNRRRHGKVKTRAQVKKLASGLRRKRKKIVFTNGCFDILHYGHVTYLKKCRRLGDILVIGLNSDSSVRKIKGKGRPVTKEKERAAVLSALEFVDYISVFSEKTPAKLIEAVTPNILAKGGDWRKKDIVGADSVKKHGGRVVTVPFVKGFSTTEILKRLRRKPRK